MSTISIDKINRGEYKLFFSLGNNNITLVNIIDFNLIKLLYELNKDIYENIELNIINDNNANLLIIYKHLFQDLGINQKYSFFKIKKNTSETNKIIFQLEMEKTDSIIKLLPENVEQIPLVYAVFECKIINDYKMDFIFNIKIDTQLIELPEFIDKFLCNIFVKMFNRFKQFIENLSYLI
jgi:hypothetical protein